MIINSKGVEHQKKLVRRNLTTICVIFVGIISVVIYNAWYSMTYTGKMPILVFIILLLGSSILIIKSSIAFGKDIAKVQQMVIQIEQRESILIFHTNKVKILKNGLFSFQDVHHHDIDRHLNFTEKYDKELGNICEVTNKEKKRVFIIIYKFINNSDEIRGLLNPTGASDKKEN